MPNQNNRLQKTNKKSKGFTLIEVTLVLLIGGVLLASFGSGLLIHFNTTKNKTTKERIEAIDGAINAYLALNQELPCPADITAPPNTVRFGQAVDGFFAAGQDCNTNVGGAPSAGTALVVGARQIANPPAALGVPTSPGVENARIGAVPTRDLNLPDEYMFDAWGSHFTYAVSADLASQGEYDSLQGVIAVVDSNNNSLLGVAASAHYVVVSHGEDQQGAININGVVVPSLCPGPPPAFGGGPNGETDFANCDGDSTFLRTILNSSVAGAGQFDDHIIYNAMPRDQGVPTGAVMAFNLAACPAGWANFAPAIGRFVLGAGAAPQIVGQANPNSGATWVDPALNTALGVFGGFRTYRLGATEMPPHAHTMQIQINQASAPNTAGNNISGGTAATVATNVANNTLNAGGAAGVAQNFDNMPAYIALTYCQKQ